MKTHSFFKTIVSVGAVCMVMMSSSGCSLDYVNPNAAAQNQVLTTREGIFSLAVGLQQYYATQTLGNIIAIPGVTARELAATTTFQNPLDLEIGGIQLQPEHGGVLGLWTSIYRAVGVADNLIANTPNTANISSATKGGIIALASLYKAMCLGHVVMYFEQAPISAGTPTASVPFRSRADVLAEAIRLLDNAVQQVPTGAAAAEFNSTVLARGMNLPNTIQAMRARFLLLAGRNADAIAAANLVNTALAGVSLFTFDTQQNRNPVYVTLPLGGNYAPIDNYGLPASLVDSADARIRFFTGAQNRLANMTSRIPVDSLASRFFATPDASIPVFRMGEMALIRAEAQARQNNLTAAVTEINTIRTKLASADPHGIGANLPPYAGAMTQDAILTEIYKQRSAELYMTGQRMEDQRRFNRPAPPNPANFQSERNRNYYPYPALERDNNVNTPPSPPI
jgi:starch-binding outer membrane protein, SusD/RagB family